MKIDNEKLMAIADETLEWLNENGFKNLVANVTVNRSDLAVKEIKMKKTLTKKQKKIIADKFPETE